MNREALSVFIRYAIITVVLIAALVFTNVFVVKPSAPTAAAAGPALAELFVDVDGKQRVACEPMCRIEAACGLRAKDACMATSCDGAVRVLAATDFEAARSGSCDQVAQLPCKDACFKQGECAADHKGDAACIDACVADAKANAAATFGKQRCVIEGGCDAIARCAAP
jgi:hypothetical protein